MNRARTMTAALAAAGILSATAACSGSAQQPPSPATTASATTGTTAATLPGTAPGAQARWLLGAIEHPPIPAAAITAHFDQVFLSKIPAAQLDIAQGSSTKRGITRAKMLRHHPMNRRSVGPVREVDARSIRALNGNAH